MKTAQTTNPVATRRGYRELAADMRRRIVTGAWAAGTRVPTKLALCREYAVSDATIQRALNVLSAEGFLHSRGCAGTWVTAAPPHVSHIGVIFPDVIARSLFWQVIVDAARQLEALGPQRFVLYEKCIYPLGPDHERLTSDLQARRLAGILTLAPVDKLMDRALATTCGVARVSISAKDPYPRGHCIRITPPAPAVLEYLHAKKRRRLALITTFSQFDAGTGTSPELARQAAALGLEIPTRFVHPISIAEHYTACQTMELMMSLPPHDRPDAVYIMDDHLVTQATLGIHKAGVISGPDAPVEVVAHANFPRPPVAHVPVTFHGHDIRGLVARAVAIITDELAGKSPPAQITLAPVFARELPYPPALT